MKYLILFLICLTSFSCEFDSKHALNTIKIGSQTWMSNNINASEITESKCYTDSTQFCSKYGALYKKRIAQKLCPKGYRLPSYEDVHELVNSINGSTNENGGKTVLKNQLSKLNILFGGFGLQRGSRTFYIGKEEQEIWLINSDSIWTDSTDTNNVKNLIGLHFRTINQDSIVVEPSFSKTPENILGYCRCIKN